jgi:hypothetical protein
MKQIFVRVGVAIVLLTALAAPAMAQVEVGASLFDFSVLKASGSDSSLKVTGVPSNSFGFTPGIYVAIPVASKLAVEGNLGFTLVSADGDTQHFVVFGGQVDFLFAGDKKSSFYAFGGGGMINNGDESDGTVSAGAGYRMVHAERVTVRFFGRYTYIFQGDGVNAFDFGVTIGGIFGKK